MTLRFTDGFDSYSATADLLKKYVSNAGATWNATAGRNGGGAIQFTTNSILQTFPITLGGSIANLGFWFKATAKPGAGTIVFKAFSSSNTLLGSLDILATGLFCLLSSVGAIVATGVTNVGDNNWHWIELLQDWKNAAATSTMYIDGILQWNASVNVVGGTPSYFQFIGVATGTQTWDDPIIYDNTGASPVNADFPLGPQQLSTTRPNADSTIQFTPDTGATNYTQVNEVNGDTTHYVQDGTSGDQDLYDFDDLSFSPAKIWGAMANAYCHNPGVGAINHNQVCKNSSSTTVGTATQTPITNPRVVQEPFVLDPATGAAWASATALNAAKFGIKVT